MNAETTLDRVMLALGIKQKEAPSIKVDLELIKTLDGQATFDADTYEVGSPIFVVTQDGNIPVPMGEYQMEDGTVVTVDDKGYIVEIATIEEEAPEEEIAIEEAKMQNAPMKEATGKPTAENPPMDMAKPKKLTESMIKTTEYSAEISDLKKEFESLKLKLSSLADENSELKNRLQTEEAPRTFFSPEAKTSKQSFQLGNRREENTTDRVFKQLFS